LLPAPSRPTPHQYCKEFGSTALSIFSARKMFRHVSFVLLKRLQSYNLLAGGEKWIFFFMAIPFPLPLGFLGKPD
jgi:hypothetical protein